MAREPFATVPQLAEWLGEDIDEESADACGAIRTRKRNGRARSTTPWTAEAGRSMRPAPT